MIIYTNTYNIKIKSINGAIIDYMEVGKNHFIKFMSDKNNSRKDYNKKSLYNIIKGNFLALKVLFTVVFLFRYWFSSVACYVSYSRCLKIFFRFDTLLNLLVYKVFIIEYVEQYFVYAKRSLDDFQEEIATTNERDKEIENMNKTRGNIKELLNNGVVDKVDKGLPVPHKDYKPLDDIKKEYDTFFDEDSGNDSVAEALKEIEEYLKGEMDSLSDSNMNKPSDLNKSEDEPNSKKEKTEDSNERDNTDLTEMPSFLDDID
jgi:hypothetical protein